MAGVTGYQGVSTAPYVYPQYTNQPTYTDAYGNIVDAQGNVLVMSPSSSMSSAPPPSFTAGNPTVEHPVEQKEKPSFGDKLGSLFKGVLDAPGKIFESLCNPKNLLMIGAGIAVSVIFPPAAPIIAGIGIAMATKGAAEGVAQTVQAWQADDLDGIRDGSGNFSANALGVALGVKGLKSSTIRSLRAAGIKRVQVGKKNVKVDDISVIQAMRLQPKVIKMGLGTFKADWANTKGSLPQRLGQMARNGAKGAPMRHRPQRRLTKAQRAALIGTTVVRGLKLYTDMKNAGMVSDLAGAWTGRTGTGFRGAASGAGRVINQLTGTHADLTARSFHEVSTFLRKSGHEGHTSAAASVLAELATVRSDVTGVLNSAKGLGQAVRPRNFRSAGTPGTAPGNAGYYRTGNFWSNTGRFAGGVGGNGINLYMNGMGILNKVTVVKNWVGKQEGLGTALYQGREFQGILTNGQSLFRAIKPGGGGLTSGWANPLTMSRSQQATLGLETMSFFERLNNFQMTVRGKTAFIGPKPTVGTPTNRLTNAQEFFKGQPGVLPAVMSVPVAAGIADRKEQKIAGIQEAYMSMMGGDPSMMGGAGIDLSSGMQQSMA